MELKKEAPSINKKDFFQFIATSFESPGQPLKTRLKKHFTFNQLKKIASNLKLNLEAPPHTLTSDNWLRLFELNQKLN
jgi:16S rRNA A1518/A1519 N6-dimethyltransferase RsmA/KsgA/DIM1 with predicted DNA glycosylase/AP lyase activity